jgi:prepilin-type N-terminal cleavage/methylation domain-containing protein
MNNNKGFTLIELIAVLMILGVLTALTIPRIMALDKTAERRVVEMGLMELNARESLYFADYMLNTGEADKYFGMNDGRLDGGFDELTIVYGDTNYKLTFRGTTYKVNRNVINKPHHWSMGKIKKPKDPKPPKKPKKPKK